MNYRRLTQHQNMEEIFLPVETKKTTLQSFISNRFLLLPIFEYLIHRYPNQTIQQVVESRNNQQFFVKFRLQEKEKSIMAGDKIYPQVIIENSYDGSIQPKVGVGYVRQVCTNGLLSFDQLTEIQVQEDPNEYVAQLLPIFEELEEMEIQTADFKKLARRQLSRLEMDWTVREMNQSRQFRFPRRMSRRAILTASLEADQLNSPMNAWLLYNGFNYTLNHLPFAFGNQNLRQLDQHVLKIIYKVTRSNYQPIALPTVQKQTALEELERYTSKMIRERSSSIY